MINLAFGLGVKLKWDSVNPLGPMEFSFLDSVAVIAANEALLTAFEAPVFH